MFLSEWLGFPWRLALEGEKKLDDSSRLNVEIARFRDMLPSLFLSCSG